MESATCSAYQVQESGSQLGNAESPTAVWRIDLLGRSHIRREVLRQGCRRPDELGFHRQSEGEHRSLGYLRGSWRSMASAREMAVEIGH